MSQKVKDPILDYYRKIIKSDYLHYGYWNSEEELKVENLHRAQERYIKHLISLIPQGAQTVLDVGCGVGGNALLLLDKGFQVEALSPDIAQQEAFKAKEDVPFYLTKFEDFQTDKRYDLILMSESTQYIPIKEGFEKSRALLNSKGYLLVSDYFLIENFNKDSVLAICTHQKNEYLKAAEEFGFEIVQSEDITSRVTPTLDLAKLKYQEYVLPTLELFNDLLVGWAPIPYKIVKFLARKPLANLEKQLQLIDSHEFVKHRQYMIYLFVLRK
ncbi:MAG: methyltransferase domain-containing protein [Stigonema ocellatum SAG 48.90 = DSM 106950]|nr:methyltransferase domain-containing protein [Stigonema ocellatum SAG 48.90 = DSM 106950]